MKSAQVPARPPEYWEQFPGEIGLRLHLDTRESGGRATGVWRARFLAYGLGLAAACLALGFALGWWRGSTVTLDRQQVEFANRYYREVAGMFPNQIQAIVLNQEGPELVLSDRPNVPVSIPYYVKICGPKGCRSFVTFSGQEITLDGERCEVLADAEGQVIVLGNHSVWSQGNRSGRVRVAARPLETTL